MTVLLRFLSQAGQIRVAPSVAVLPADVVLKIIVINDFSERLCLVSGDDAGHNGDNFAGLAFWEWLVDGVSEGTQKDGRVGFADCIASVSERQVDVYPTYTLFIERFPRLRSFFLYILRHFIFIKLKLSFYASTFTAGWVFNIGPLR